MSIRIRQEAGFTLIETLIVMSLMLVVLGATLTTFTSFDRQARDNDRRNESAEIARRSLDIVARQLRNLAKRFSVTQATILVADPNNFVFQTSDPSKKWIRYCLDATGPGGTANGRLWAAESGSSAITTEMKTGACPPATGAGKWTTSRIVTDKLVNDYNSVRPVFRYGCPAVGGCTTDFTLIKSVGVRLFVDRDPGRNAKELEVTTGVFMRNQNQDPIALFSGRYVPIGTAFLNASASSDPEGRTLRYFWFKTAVPTTWTRCDQAPPEDLVLSRGVTMTYTFGATETSATFALAVCDPGDLMSTATTMTISKP